MIRLRYIILSQSIRNPAVTTVPIPASVGDKWQAVIAHVMNKHGIEIAGGLGEVSDKHRVDGHDFPDERSHLANRSDGTQQSTTERG